jgi:hypothetical protein
MTFYLMSQKDPAPSKKRQLTRYRRTIAAFIVVQNHPTRVFESDPLLGIHKDHDGSKNLVDFDDEPRGNFGKELGQMIFIVNASHVVAIFVCQNISTCIFHKSTDAIARADPSDNEGKISCKDKNKFDYS